MNRQRNRFNTFYPWMMFVVITFEAITYGLLWFHGGFVDTGLFWRATLAGLGAIFITYLYADEMKGKV